MSTLSTLKVYGYLFQTKVLYSLLNDKEFLHSVIEALTSEYFENQPQKWIVDKIIEYYKKYNTTVTLEVLQVEVKKLENEILKVAVVDQLKEAYSVSNEDLVYIETEFLNFCKNQQLKQALLTSVDLLNAGDYEGIRVAINKAMKAGQDRNIGHEYDKDIESRYREDDRSPIPFPWDVFNKMTQGGVGKGDLVLIPGNPGGGKTWALIAIGAFAASLGYNVFHYTLELAEGYVGKRYDAVFSGIDVDKLHLHRNEVEQIVGNIKGKIIIKEYPPMQASYETIKTHMRQIKTQYNIEPNIVLIDYIDYIKTPPRKDKTEELNDVYIGGKGLAKELQIPIISPVQANRTGAKNNILEGDNLAGNYSKLMIADMVVSFARTRVDKVNGTGRWHWMKNRFGPDGLTYASEINTANGKIVIADSPLTEEEVEPKANGTVSTGEKKFLKQKFLELQ